jgi:hypothetical protein
VTVMNINNSDRQLRWGGGGEWAPATVRFSVTMLGMTIVMSSSEGHLHSRVGVGGNDS